MLESVKLVYLQSYLAKKTGVSLPVGVLEAKITPNLSEGVGDSRRNAANVATTTTIPNTTVVSVATTTYYCYYH